MQKYSQVRLFFQDESRFGLKTIKRRKITLKGCKPIGKIQQGYKNFYIYGVIEPETGENFFLEFSTVDKDCFQIFLSQLSKEYPEDFMVIVIDGAGFHSTKGFKVPENIQLIKLPPYSPELNPIERLWQDMKDKLAWKIYSTLSELEDDVAKIIRTLSKEEIRSISLYDYILKALKYQTD